MFQYYSLKSSHPCLLPQSSKLCSLHLCLFCYLDIGSLLPSFKIPYICVNILYGCFSFWLTSFSMLLLLLLSRFSCVSDSVRPHRWQPTRLPRPWYSPGKNTGVGCHFLLLCMKVKSESEIAQSCPTLSDPMDCSPPGCSIHGIFQARVLEWGAIAFSFTLYNRLQFHPPH